MNGDRHVEALGFIEDRIKNRICHHPVSFERPHANSDRAMLLGETNLGQRFGRRQRRNDAGPAQPIVTELPNICQPAVPTPAQRDLRIGAFRQRRNPERVVDHLHIDAEFVHMLEPPLHVGKLARLNRRSDVSAEFFQVLRRLLFVRRRKLGSYVFAVEKPRLPSRFARQRHELRPVFFLRGVEIVPYLFVLDDVRVRIDDIQIHFSRRRHASLLSQHYPTST